MWRLLQTEAAEDDPLRCFRQAIEEHEDAFTIGESDAHFCESASSVLKYTEVTRGVFGIFQSFREELRTKLILGSDVETGEALREHLPLLTSC